MRRRVRLRRAYRNVCYAGWDGRADIAWPGAGVALSHDCGPCLPPSDASRAGGEPVFCLEPQTAAPCAFDGLEAGRVRRRPYPRARRPGFGDASVSMSTIDRPARAGGRERPVTGTPSP